MNGFLRCLAAEIINVLSFTSFFGKNIMVYIKESTNQPVLSSILSSERREPFEGLVLSTTLSFSNGSKKDFFMVIIGGNKSLLNMNRPHVMAAL